MTNDLPARLRRAATYALMDAARATVLEAADALERGIADCDNCLPLRDTFAAAALTGLLACPPAGPAMTFDEYAAEAFQMADAMLRERERTAQKMAESDSSRAVSTNHDAAPAAITVSDEDRTDKAATSHRRDRSGKPPGLAKGQVPLGSASVAGTNSCRRPSQPGGFSDRIRQFFCNGT